MNDRTPAEEVVNFFGRLLLGAIAGFLIGSVIAMWTLHFYPVRPPDEPRSFFEERQNLFFWRVLVGVTVAATLAAGVAGRWKLGRRATFAGLGIAGGMAFAALMSLLFAYFRDEFPFRQIKGAGHASIQAGFYFGVPVCAIAGGIVGFVVSRRGNKHAGPTLPPHSQT